MKAVVLSLLILTSVIGGITAVYYARGVNAHGTCADPEHEKNITVADDPEHYSEHRDPDGDGVVCEDGSAVTPQQTPTPTPVPTPTATPTPGPTPTPFPMESELAAQIANTPHGRTLGFLPDAPPV